MRPLTVAPLLLLLLSLSATLIAPPASCCRTFDPKGTFEGGDGAGRQLLQVGTSCGDVLTNIDLPSRDNVLNDGTTTITGSADECCSICDETPDCKSWTRIKSRTTFNNEGECWLRSSVPTQVQCEYCDSGIMKEGSADTNDTTDSNDPNAALDKCEADGSRAGVAAGRAACAILKSVCPAPLARSALPADAPSDEFADQVIERACNVLFETNCKRNGTVSAFADNSCGAILGLGPGKDPSGNPVPGCENVTVANTIFDNELSGLCEAN